MAAAFIIAFSKFYKKFQRLKRLSITLLRGIMWNFPLRYYSQNYLVLIATFVFELRSFGGPKRVLNDSS
jgi:hypothetical protein